MSRARASRKSCAPAHLAGAQPRAHGSSHLAHAKLPEAVRFAEKACQLTDYRVITMVGTLAAAYAEAGRFEEAVSTGEQARALALEVGQTDLAERNAQLMELYRAHRPYHEVTATNAASPVSGSSRERSP